MIVNQKGLVSISLTKEEIEAIKDSLTYSNDTLPVESGLETKLTTEFQRLYEELKGEEMSKY